ncbi:histidine phosphatase superfamily, partial [Cladochytrium replicatum]
TFALANGTVLTAPDNGYQQVPVHVVSQDQDVVLRGWFNCPKLDTAVNSFYVSDAYKAKEAAARNFLDSKISPLFNDKVFALSDMWNVFDYLNVQKSYNPNFPNLDEASWDTIRDLVSFLEYNKFHNGLGASSFAADLVWLLNSFKTPATSSSPLRKMSLYSGHYTTFVSFFGLSGLSTKNPELRGIPSYGSLLLFEFLKDPAMNEFYVRTVFRNGTRADVGGPAITSYAVGTPSNADATISKLDDFISTLKASGNLPVSSSLKSFCDVCGNNATRSCDLYAAQNALRGLQGGTVPGSPAAIRSLGDVYAGLIGAAVTLILCMIVATAFGLSAWNRWKKGYEQAVLAAVASSAGAEEDLIISEKKAAAALKSESS